ncbi:hypothetical protein E1B28_007023 [Marasmius oreades]|uniref:Cyclochlorotine biosynthesis protein O n=1 Tax=Marasmius oreades TaxID=181124 RepID=A0A9P7S2G8_9AGAR|nr:uncharacterized protein E1B28_007023 [Marasmius oreades]KAG7093343.1 hypothetical protein E1B28_007023 [Marasmius oreades]
MSRKEQGEAFDSVSYEPLLRGDSDSPVEGQSAPGSRRVEGSPLRRWTYENRKRWVTLVLGITNVITLLILLSLWLRRESIPDSELQLLYSPANHVIEHQVTTFHSAIQGDTTEYMGTPSPELDKAWGDLYKYGLQRIPEDEAKLIPWKTVRIPGDESHYAVALDVFHQLHCLNIIRKAFHPDYYPKEEQWHVDHCIEHIRQAIVCSSDVSLIIWQWFPEKNKTLGRSGTPHTCRNFDKIYEWAKDPKNNLPADQFNLDLHPPHDHDH